MLPVILSGGSGTRLWPLSRKQSPKQFLRLLSEYSLFQETLLRLQGLNLKAPLVISHQDYRFMVAEHCRELDIQPEAIILEPLARGTAPAVALAAEYFLESGLDQPMLILPADHKIDDIALLHEALGVAGQQALNDQIVTLGVKPTMAESGFGYIQRGEKSGNGFAIKEFVEKPGVKTAQRYLEEGCYFWNTGIFLVKPSVYLAELTRFKPDIVSACHEAFQASRGELDFFRVDETHFSDAQNISVDCAVMEHTRIGFMVPLMSGWSDVGSWAALKAISDKDALGNVIQGDILAYNCRNSYLRSDGKLLATVGLDNMIVVETADAVLVADANSVSDVSSVIRVLEKRNDQK